MDIENIGEELENLVSKFELTKSCLHLESGNARLSKLLKERDSLSFWNNLDYAMQTNKEIKSLQELFNKVQVLQERISGLIKTIKDLEKKQIWKCLI